ncbi:MAG: ATP-binding cassette domain-containing protein [Bdellovibrio sp.]|nr:ATP-binding cassette domain-containing protein [Bdellovibrio sp.]
MLIQIDNLLLKQNDFSFLIKKCSIESGQHLLIEGSSGIGKTSFLHLLAGFLKPTAGSIQMGSHKIVDLSAVELCEFRRAHVGMIFQKIHLLPHLTLLENVKLGLTADDSKNHVQSLIQQLGLENRLNHVPKQLSLGETQRASIARALVSKHQIILADEPTASLDDDNAEIVFNLLKEKAKGSTLLLVTHDHRARAFFDKTINFKDLISP